VRERAVRYNVRTLPPGTSSAAVGGPRFVASPASREHGNLSEERMGVFSRWTPPRGLTASLRPSSCRRQPSSPSSPFLLLEWWLLSLAHRARLGTTGGLSGPPSYKM